MNIPAPVDQSFIDEFNTWRKSQISTNYSNYTTVDVNTLTPENFLRLSTTEIDPSTRKKIDVVKVEADKYFMDVTSYHMTDEARKSLGLTKPTLSTEISDAIGGYSENLEKYSELWACNFWDQQSVKSQKYSKIKPIAITDFNKMNKSKIINRIQMRMTFIATCKKVPGFIPYMYNSTVKQKVKNYLLDKENQQKWVEDTFNSVTKSIHKADIIHQNEKLSQLKTKLDILDPSFDLSTIVLKEYGSNLFGLAAPLSFKNTPKIKQLFIKVTEHFLGMIKSSATHVWKSQVTKLLTFYDNEISILSKFIGDGLHQISVDLATLAKRAKITADKVLTFSYEKFMNKIKKIQGALPNNEEAKTAWEHSITRQVFSGIFVMASAAVIYFSFKNYDKLNTEQKVVLWVATAQTGADALLTITEAVQSGYKACYGWVGSKIASLFKKNVVGPISGTMKSANIIKFTALIKLTKFLKVCTGVLMVVSIGISFYETIASFLHHEWALAAVSVVELSLSITVFILTFFVSTAWSGPVSLFLTGLLIIALAIKMFWDQIDEFFNGNPEENFYAQVGSKYIRTKEEYQDYMLDAVDAYDKEHPENAFVTRLIRQNVLNGEIIGIL